MIAFIKFKFNMFQGFFASFNRCSHILHWQIYRKTQQIVSIAVYYRNVADC